jgi:glycosyl hydrolase family 100 (putative invertase)
LGADSSRDRVAEVKSAAIEVLLHNSKGPYNGLPRTAGWGYPEPYTRDLMIAGLGILVSGNPALVKTQRRVLETAAAHQSEHGHIPSLIHDAEDRGASDTTPLFLLAAAAYREASGDKAFLQEAVNKALQWMTYQSPDDRVIVAQLPTSDWRDEQWVLGYGLFVNTVVYSYLRMFGENRKADTLQELLTRFAVRGGVQHRHVHEGLRMPTKPYYALWSYKVYNNERFDLLGNSMAILCGMASKSRSQHIITWIERECAEMQRNGQLSVDLPPNLFPFIQEKDPDWMPRYAEYNRPGEYHNGGIWPFVCGFYVAALVAAGRCKLAEQKLDALARLMEPAREAEVAFGFNEWFRAQDGTPRGLDWQTWSAAMYLYAAVCVEERRTPFFEAVRKAG